MIIHPGGVNHISMVGNAWGTLSGLGARLLPHWGCVDSTATRRLFDDARVDSHGWAHG